MDAAAVLASANRPTASSHRGDSGAISAMATTTSSGAKPSAAVPRQPSTGKRLVTTTEASRSPRPAGIPMALVRSVRCRRGVYSAISANCVEPAPP